MSPEPLSPRRVRWLFYAERPRRRTRQFVADVAVLVWTALVVSAAITLHTAALTLQEPGRGLGGAGASVRDAFAGAAGTAAGVPLVGDDLAGALGGGTRAGDALVAAGQQEVEAVAGLATGVSWLLVVLAAVPVLALWATVRARWMLATRAVLAVRDGVQDADLLALRALTLASPARVTTAVPDAAAGWRRGDVHVLARLADLELARLGLRGPSVVRGTLSDGMGGDPEKRWGDTPPPPDPSMGRTS